MWIVFGFFFDGIPGEDQGVVQVNKNRFIVFDGISESKY